MRSSLASRIATAALLAVSSASCASAPPAASTLSPQPSSSVEVADSASTSPVDSAPPDASSGPAPGPPARQPVVPPEKLPDFDPALVKELDAAGREKLEVAASLCQAAVKHEGKAVHVGCRSCPPFDRESGPDGKVVVDPVEDGGATFFPIEKVFRGSFSASGIDEAAVVFAGCESHAENYGGTMLVGRPGKVWVEKSYRSGFHPDDCKPFTKPDGRMLLVCRWETSHQGFGHEMLDVYDFVQGKDDDVEAGWTHLVDVDTDVYGNCLIGAPDGEVNVGSIADFHFDTATPDRSQRLVVTVRGGSGKRTKAFNAKCAEFQKEMEKEKPREIDLRAAVPTKKHTFAFRWDKTKFVSDDSK